MADRLSILILSDPHYAGASEIKRGWREYDVIRSRWLRLAVRIYRHFLWKRDPFEHNYLLEQFLEEGRSADLVVANGDYSCDTAFVGLSDDASFESASECVGRLRQQFGSRLHLTIGDHELGKMSLFGGCGGLRLASWHRTVEELGLKPYWRIGMGRFVLLGVTSSLLALPVYEPETLPSERPEWLHLRASQMECVRAAFNEIEPDQRIILFCHDPTALPFLWREHSIRAKLGQISQTVIGHLHSEFYLRNSRLMAGIPTIGFLGTSIRRMSAALREARLWEFFHVRLCPALAGIQLLKDGGYYELKVEPDGPHQPEFQFHPLPWQKGERAMRRDYSG